MSSPAETIFTRDLPRMLRALRRHNSRDWFLAHREEYDDAVVRPLRALGEQLLPVMLGMDDRLHLKLSRPHRDVRFSRDKAPYRTNAWLAFRRAAGETTDVPTFFLEVSPEGARCGLGYYAARPRTMALLREAALADPAAVTRAFRRALAGGFTIEGESYRREPRLAPDIPEFIAELYRRRNIYLSQALDYDDDFFTATLFHRIRDGFAALAPCYRFFTHAADHPPPDGRR